MRVLFNTGGSAATVFALTPLAAALRTLGHQVFMAANTDLMPAIAGTGIPAVAVVEQPIQHFVWTDRAGNTVRVPTEPGAAMRHMGASFARMAAAGLDALLALAEDWRPDLVVGGAMSYAAPLLATHLRVPYVRHAWDTIPPTEIDPGAEEELRPELRRFGLAALPRPDLFVDICPPSLRAPDAPPARPMRWIPGNRQCRLERWMYRRGDRPHRALVTAGTRAFMPQNVAFLRRLSDALASLDVEVLVAAPEDVAQRLRAELADVRAGWIPLDVVAPTCDVILHHGGGVTAMTALNAGVPQLMIPLGTYLVSASMQISGAGAGITLTPGHDSAEETAKACQEILSDPAYTRRARALAAEIATLPTPDDMARVLTGLATAAAGAGQARGVAG
jgi:UDP:flavonoid glycosyltransferase YjiC (YdhE family)